MVKKIKHNDLLPWFLEDHGKLPAGYLKSVEKFLISYKLQVASRKQQATSSPQLKSIVRNRKV